MVKIPAKFKQSSHAHIKHMIKQKPKTNSFKILLSSCGDTFLVKDIKILKTIQCKANRFILINATRTWTVYFSFRKFENSGEGTLFIFIILYWYTNQWEELQGRLLLHTNLLIIMDDV